MKIILSLILTCVSSMSLAQFGVAYHHSNIPFVSLNYELGGRLRPELRLGTDTFFEEVSLEGVVVFDIINTADYELYLGAGLKSDEFSGVVIPFGINVYPLEKKKFGFHIELAPIIDEYEILRGSWGIRYKFE